MVASARGAAWQACQKGTFLNNLRDSHKTGFPCTPTTPSPQGQPRNPDPEEQLRSEPACL